MWFCRTNALDQIYEVRSMSGYEEADLLQEGLMEEEDAEFPEYWLPCGMNTHLFPYLETCDKEMIIADPQD